MSPDSKTRPCPPQDLKPTEASCARRHPKRRIPKEARTSSTEGGPFMSKPLDRAPVRCIPSCSSEAHAAFASTIVFHGDRDAVVSPINGTHVIEASFGVDCSFDCCEHTGPDGRRFTRRNYTRSGVCGEHWTLHDAAHAWSGGNLAGSFADPLGPDASEEMLRFFETQRRVPSRAPRRGRRVLSEVGVGTSATPLCGACSDNSRRIPRAP